MTTDSDRTFWTPEDLSRAASAGGRPVTTRRIRQLLMSGVLSGRKVSGVWLIGGSVARAWLKEWLEGK